MNRRAEIDRTYTEAYATHDVHVADEWGDLANFGEAVRAAWATRTPERGEARMREVCLALAVAVDCSAEPGS